MGEIEELKIDATLNYIKDSETILNGEYYVIHSDFIIALEEEIKKLKKPSIIIEIKDIEEIRKTIEEQQHKIDKAIEYIQNHQLVFEISNKKQIAYWFDMFYKDILEILGEK